MIALGAWGWEHAAWDGGFYSEDLPREWWLTFYSNEFDAVGLDAGAWLAPDIDTLRGWVEDTREGFRFVLMLPDQPSKSMVERLGVLAPRIGSLLAGVEVSVEVIEAARRFGPVWAMASSKDGGGALPPVAHGLVEALDVQRAPLVLVDADGFNLRAARIAMESLGNRGDATILLRDAGASFPVLNEIRTLRDLLGWQ